MLIFPNKGLPSRSWKRKSNRFGRKPDVTLTGYVAAVFAFNCVSNGNYSGLPGRSSKHIRMKNEWPVFVLRTTPRQSSLCASLKRRLKAAGVEPAAFWSLNLPLNELLHTQHRPLPHHCRRGMSHSHRQAQRRFAVRTRDPAAGTRIPPADGRHGLRFPLSA